MAEFKRGAGQRNMYVVGAYKEKLLDELKLDPDFQVALLGHTLNTSSAKEKDFVLREAFEDCVFDHAFVPNTETEEQIFVCMEVTCPYADAVTWKDLYIYVYVFTPKKLVKWNTCSEMKTKTYLEERGYIGNKIDMVVDIIDRKINGYSGLALGSIRLAPRDGMQIFSYVDGHYGKQLTYTATDFNLLPPNVIQGDYLDGEIE